ncbi:MAG: hypothetical protein ACRDIU_08795 [Actinomycetota bacterium]
MNRAGRSMASGLAACLAASLLGAGCTDRKVLIAYRLEGGQRTHYEWSIEATSRLTTPNEVDTTRLSTRLTVEETVLAAGRDGRRRVRLRLKPKSLREDGIALPLPRPSSVEFGLDTSGRVTGVKGSLSHGNRTPELGTLASEIRPGLSPVPVGIGETWPSPLRASEAGARLNLSGTGRLEGYDFLDRRRIALIETNRRGSIRSGEIIDGASVVLSGKTRSSGRAAVDVDRRALVYSNQRSVTDFDLLSGESRTGKMRVTRTSRLRLIGGGAEPAGRS